MSIILNQTQINQTVLENQPIIDSLSVQVGNNSASIAVLQTDVTTLQATTGNYGDVVQYNVGILANNIPQLQTGGQMPNVGGANLQVIDPTTSSVSDLNTALANINGGSSGTGTVTSVSISTTNGFAGNVATPNTTPQLAIEVTQNGILKGNSGAIQSATIADYPVATNSSMGIVQADGTTTTITNGVLSTITQPQSTTQYFIPGAFQGNDIIYTMLNYTDTNNYTQYIACTDFQSQGDGSLALFPINGLLSTNNISFDVNMTFFAGQAVTSTPVTFTFDYDIVALTSLAQNTVLVSGNSGGTVTQGNITIVNFTSVPTLIGFSNVTQFFIRMYNISGQTANGQTPFIQISVTPIIS